jgi:multisubunit Na+/H+ antiporter MnhB subunit
MTELYVLLGLMIVGAIVAIWLRNLLSSVITLGVIGLGVSVVFLLLKAPDIALTQLVVEIMAVIILIRSTINRDVSAHDSGTRPLGSVFGLAMVVLLVFAGFHVLRLLPPFGHPLMLVSSYYPRNGVVETGAVNIVTSIILDYRGYDTLGEATILFTAVVGVLTVMRSRGRKSEDEQVPESEE